MIFIRETPDASVGKKSAVIPDTLTSINSEITGVKWICTKAETSGYSIDLSMRGSYDITFNADNTASMNIEGIIIPEAKWMDDGEEIIVDSYSMLYIFKRIEPGLQMNYFDTMLLTYEQEK